jgi:hypothetical protein
VRGITADRYRQRPKKGRATITEELKRRGYEKA